MVGALLLGFVCGVIARILMPGDAFRNMSGPASWAVSVGLGLVGALVGYVIFTLGLGIGDTDIFDWGGLFSALIGTLIVVGLASYFLRRRQPRPSPSTSPSPDSGIGGHQSAPDPGAAIHHSAAGPGAAGHQSAAAPGAAIRQSAARPGAPGRRVIPLGQRGRSPGSTGGRAPQPA